MKITVFNGSPRKAAGNTHIMTEAFLEGAREAGAEADVVFLADKHIKPCLGCLSCWLKTPGKCVHDDDMKELLPLMESDILVFATPVYVDNVTGIMKMFIDRLITSGDPHFEKDEHGETRHVNTQGKSPKFVVISNCGYPEQTHFQVISHFFNRMARNFHTEVVGEIYRGEGELLRSSPLLLKPIIASYKNTLKKAGREIVEEGRLSEDTRAKLEKPLVPYDQYLSGAEKYWNETLKSLKKKDGLS
jgi:multimeric flavodoxin WrbA